MNALQAQLTPDEVVACGKALYEQSIRAEVEEGNIGRLLLVDVTTGNWVMGEDRIEMARRLRARNPQAQNYGMRVGYPATTAIGTSLRPLNEANQPQWRVRRNKTAPASGRSNLSLFLSGRLFWYNEAQ